MLISSPRFTPDVIPTTQHLGAAYNMAYDVEPFISMVTRRWYLKEAVENDWLLVLDTEPAPCGTVSATGLYTAPASPPPADIVCEVTASSPSDLAVVSRSSDLASGGTGGR